MYVHVELFLLIPFELEVTFSFPFQIHRITFSTSSQLHVMCQIIVDKAQPMSNKVCACVCAPLDVCIGSSTVHTIVHAIVVNIGTLVI